MSRQNPSEREFLTFLGLRRFWPTSCSASFYFSSAPSGPRFTLALIYCFRSALPLAARDAGVLLALAWQPVDWLVLDGSGDLGLLSAARSLSIFAGFTLTPARF